MQIAIRSLAVLSFLCSILLTSRSASAQVGNKENLDLPFDAVGEDEDEEDAPEIVQFYNQNLEGDGFFYVIDRSSSMSNSGELERAKREVVKNISEFSSRVQFGVFFFSSDLSKFPSSGQPAQANEGMKSAGKSFVQSTPGSSGSCPHLGLAAALQMANMATSKRKVVVYLGDGGGTCQGTSDEAGYLNKTLAQITSQNYQRHTINTLGILDVSAIGEAFLKKLAGANSGTYTKINS